jgi:adenylate cyclase
MPLRRTLGSVLALAFLAVLTAAGALRLGWGPLGLIRDGLERVDARLYRTMLAAAPPLPSSGRVVLVTVDEASEEKLGAWPFPRRLHGRLLRRLHAAHAAGVIFDVAFSRPSDDQDDGAFADALRTAGPAVIGMSSKVVDGRPIAALPTDLFLQASAGVAYNDVDPERTTEVLALSRSEPMASFNSMLVAGLLMLGGENPSRIVHGSGGDDLAVGQFTVPTRGDYVVVNYRIAALPEISYGDALSRPLPDLTGRLVVVGRVDDPHVYYAVPGGSLPAAAIMARAIDGVLGGTAIRWVAPAITWALVYAIGGAGVIAFVLLHSRRPRLAYGAVLSAFGLVLAAAWALFAGRHLWAEVGGPLIAVVGAWLVLVLANTATARRVLATMVPDHVSEQVSHGTVETRVAEAAVLFQDIQGYTSIAESMAPERVLELLNAYYGSQERIIRGHGGEVLDFQGDAQMIVFGLAEGGPDPAVAAVETAWSILENVPPEHGFQFGMGIATGRVALGLIRGGQRRQYTALGATTNLASRLQAATRGLDPPLLVDERTWERVRSRFEGERLDNLELKGISGRATGWKILRRSQTVEATSCSDASS